MVDIDTVLVTSSILYLVIVELITLTRQTEYVSKRHSGRPYRDLDYEETDFILDIMPRRFGQWSTSLMEFGSFGFSFMLTEIVCMFSIWFLWTSPINQSGVWPVLYLPIVLLWIFLPALVVPEYTQLIHYNVLPRSLDIHLLNTMIFILPILGFPHIMQMLNTDLQIQIASLIWFALLSILFIIKTRYFLHYLRSEIAFLRPT